MNPLGVCASCGSNNWIAWVCKSCFLVQYCTKKCKKAHSVEHKKVCKISLMKPRYSTCWEQQRRVPDFIKTAQPLNTFGEQNSLWRQQSALDILNLQRNEAGRGIDQDFNILFAVSGDLGSAMKTVLGLPESYTKHCKILLNDPSYIIVARNIIILLVAFHFDTSDAVPIMIHLWYSAFLPSSMAKLLQHKILPYISDFCEKIQLLEPKDPNHLHAVRWQFPFGGIRVVLKQDEWMRMARYLVSMKGFSKVAAQATRQRVTLAPERVDHRDQTLYVYSDWEARSY
jgi:hypothetical protein